MSQELDQFPPNDERSPCDYMNARFSDVTSLNCSDTFTINSSLSYVTACSEDETANDNSFYSLNMSDTNVNIANQIDNNADNVKNNQAAMSEISAIEIKDSLIITMHASEISPAQIYNSTEQNLSKNSTSENAIDQINNDIEDSLKNNFKSEYTTDQLENSTGYNLSNKSSDENVKLEEDLGSKSPSKRFAASNEQRHSRRRKLIIDENNNRFNSRDSSYNEDSANNQEEYINVETGRTLRKSKIPLPLHKIKGPEFPVTDEKENLNVKSNDRKFSYDIMISEHQPKINRSYPTILEITSAVEPPTQTVEKEDSISTPALVKKDKTAPKKKPYTLKKPPSKVIEKNNSFLKVPRKAAKTSTRGGAAKDEGGNQGRWNRRRTSITKMSLKNSTAAISAVQDKEDAITPVAPILDTSHKLSTLEARYKIQLKRYNTQNKELSGITFQLESTKKTVQFLMDQIKALGGTIPAGDLASLDETVHPCSPIKFSSAVKETNDKETTTDLTSVNDANFPGNAFQLKEENKLLLNKLEQLQGENNSKDFWVSKYLQEMKFLEECSELTSVSCTEALQRQNELNDKLKMFEREFKELTALTKDGHHNRATVFRLKTELSEQKSKLEYERNSKNELEIKLNQELLSERAKLKAERSKRENLQSQLAIIANEKNALNQEKHLLNSQLRELSDRLMACERQENDRIASLQKMVNEKEELIKKMENNVAELTENKAVLENQIVEMDLGSKTTHSSIVEMSKQLLNKDEQLSEMKKMIDDSFNENTALIDLLHFISASNALDLNDIKIADIGNNPEVLNSIKERIKEALLHKPSSSITETLVREQAEQIRDQSANIQHCLDEVNRVNAKYEQLISINNAREKEINLLKEENMKLLEKLKLMESFVRCEVTRKEQDGLIKEMSGGNDGKAADGKVSFDQLLTMLVAKGEALARMESKVKHLESVHSMCARRRARGESRIAHLETILQNDPTCWEEMIITN